jgi:hypothetical protein
MTLFQQFLGVAALVLFILAGLGIPSGKYNLIGWGLACVTLAWLIGAFGLR